MYLTTGLESQSGLYKRLSEIMRRLLRGNCLQTLKISWLIHPHLR